jgi:hypothetical protein
VSNFPSMVNAEKMTKVPSLNPLAVNPLPDESVARFEDRTQGRREPTGSGTRTAKSFSVETF